MTERGHGSSIVVAYVGLARMATILSRSGRPYPTVRVVALDLRRGGAAHRRSRRPTPASDLPSVHRHWAGHADELTAPSEPSQ